MILWIGEQKFIKSSLFSNSTNINASPQQPCEIGIVIIITFNL